MAQPWSQVIASPAYQQLGPDEREAARQQYFSQVVAPQVSDPSQVQAVKQQFDAQTGAQATPFGQNVQKAVAQANTEDQPSFGQQLGRAFIRAGKAVGEGITGTADLLASPIRAGLNAVLPANMQAGTTTDYFNKAVQNALPNTDLTPQNTTERYVDAIERGLGSATAGMGIGAGLAGAANPTTAAVGNIMASNPGMQLASATTGASSAQLAKDQGAGQLGQIAAGLAGGLVPAIPSLAGVAAQGALRGGEAGRQTVAQNIADFANAGTTPTVGQATQTPLAQSAESLLAKTPGAVNVMKGAAQNQANQVSSGLNNLADTLAPNADTGAAGRAITRGISGEGGFIDRFKQQAGELYDKLDQHLAPDTRVPITNTQQVLPELNALIQGAPNTSKLFQNARIMGIENGLKADALSPEAAMTRPDVQAAMAQMKSKIDAYNAQTQAANDAGQTATEQSNTLRSSVPGMKPIEFQPKPLISDQETQQHLQNVASSMVDNQLPYQAVKQLRSLVGDQLSDFTLASDVPRSKWKAVYSALSDDLKGAADAQSPEAAQAWNRANNYYKAGQARIDALSGVVDKNGGPEQVFNAAMSGTKDGASTLKSVMHSLQPDQQKVLSAAVINRLGKATPGQQNAAGDEFSMGSFLTNWNKLSPQAKSTLFDGYGPTFSKDMDSIANVASNVRTGSKYLSNPSGTAASSAQIGTVGAFITSALTGHPGAAAAIAGGMGLANLGARLMTNPTFVKFLATKSNVPLQGLPSIISSLRVSAQEKKDPDLNAAANAIQQAATQPAQQAAKP